MNDTLDNVIDELVDGGSNFAASLGINRVAGQLYVLLFFSEKPLSLDEIMEKLGISKGYVSTNIRALERWQAVRKVWVKGTRKDFYEANTDTISIVVNQLEYGLRQRFDELEKVIKRAKDKLKNAEGTTPEENESQKNTLDEKINSIEKMHSKMIKIVDKMNLLMIFK
ncbi:MAG: ArsR family transcriptional regulator [Candidatus Omnitrophica bacterium]|nr:ArsR family transcriptional regulator [Candidatus Omnitrophota bacterium]